MEGDGDMIMQLTTGDPIANSFHFIIYIFRGEGGGGDALEPSLMQPCCFFRLLVEGGDNMIMQPKN